MGTLQIKDMKPEEAMNMNFDGYSISLKLDGTLIYYMNGKLISPRCDRSDRFKHILDILVKSNFPNCIGEMFLDVKGSCVFDVSRSENWDKVKFYPFQLIDNTKSFNEGQKILAEKVKELNNPFIKPLITFGSFKEGWNYVKANDSEGLVIRNSHSWIKVKTLKEVKIEIKEHEPSKEKGTFILINGNRVSGTSKDFVKLFHELKAQGKTPMGEIEFPFMTESGAYFQGRLRRIFPKGEEII